VQYISISLREKKRIQSHPEEGRGRRKQGEVVDSLAVGFLALSLIFFPAFPLQYTVKAVL
jgi:hypothetical protein